jgi:hypothetical protein
MMQSSVTPVNPICVRIISVLACWAEIIFFLFSINGCSNERNIVATIGGKKITLNEFRQAYLQVLKQPQYFDSPEMREKFLDELIDQYLFAEQARQKGREKNGRLQMRVQAYKDKCLRDAHYLYVIKPRITIDSSEVKKIYAFTRQKRKISHLFCPDSLTADSIYTLLKKGKNWNVLARELFADTGMARSGGDLGWVYWDQLEYDLAMTAFQLPLHVVSKPVRSTWGYHLLRVDDYELDLMMSEDDYTNHYVKTRELIEYKKGDKIAAAYISDMMKNIKIRIDPRLLQKVGAQLRTILIRPAKPFDQMSEQQLTVQEIKKVEDTIWNYRHNVLAIIDDQKMTIGDFAGMLNYIPYNVLRQSLKTTLDYAIRDFVLTTEAKKLQLDKKNHLVNIKTDLFATYQLQLDQRHDLIRAVSVSDQEIYSFYQKNHISLFKNSPMDSVREMIHQQILNEKQIALLADTLQSLKQRFPITRHMEVINTFYDKIEGKQTGDQLNVDLYLLQ